MYLEEFFYISFLDLIMKSLKCVFSYIQSAEFVSECYDFDIAINMCTNRDIRCKISDHFSCVSKRNSSLSTGSYFYCVFT